jgi:hypothetical protein
MKKLTVIGIIILTILLMFQYPHAMLNAGQLAEGHQNIKDNCTSCHAVFGGLPNNKCITCHTLSGIGKDTFNVNDGDSTDRKVLFHQHLSLQKCTSCHTDHNGTKGETYIRNFNHEILPANVLSNCGSCHVQPTDSLHKQVINTCSKCHNTKGWKSSVQFNHDMILLQNKNNRNSCHKKPEDSFHQSLKENCNNCHSTNQWKPSTFDHSAYFILDRDHNVECNTCHTQNNYISFTCYGCHEHSEGKIREEHTEHGITNFSNCVSCHRSADEHDIKHGNSDGRVEGNELNNVKKYIQSKEKDHEKRKHHHDE